MPFELHISCSKDIDELHINFSDGTSSVVSKNDNDYQNKKEKKELREPKEQVQTYSKTKPKEEKEFRRPLDTYLDTEEDVIQKKQDKIELPVIPDKQSFKVADELQNLDI